MDQSRAGRYFINAVKAHAELARCYIRNILVGAQVTISKYPNWDARHKVANLSTNMPVRFSSPTVDAPFLHMNCWLTSQILVCQFGSQCVRPSPCRIYHALYLCDVCSVPLVRRVQGRINFYYQSLNKLPRFFSCTIYMYGLLVKGPPLCNFHLAAPPPCRI